MLSMAKVQSKSQFTALRKVEKSTRSSSAKGPSIDDLLSMVPKKDDERKVQVTH